MQGTKFYAVMMNYDRANKEISNYDPEEGDVVTVTSDGMIPIFSKLCDAKKLAGDYYRIVPMDLGEPKKMGVVKF